MIGTLCIKTQAQSPNLPLPPLATFVSSPSTVAVTNVPGPYGLFKITAVKLTVTYPNGETQANNCKLADGKWTCTLPGTGVSGVSKNGYAVWADGEDEEGRPVAGYILGKGDVIVLEHDGSLNPDEPSTYVHLLSAQPATPHEGDIFPTLSGYCIWQDGKANPLGGGESVDVSAILSAANAYTDDKAQQTLSAAIFTSEDFARNGITNLEDEIKDGTIITWGTGRLGNYDDGWLTKTDVLDSISAGDANALSSAKAYTDISCAQTLAQAKTYTDEREENLTALIDERAIFFADDARQQAESYANYVVSNRVVNAGGISAMIALSSQAQYDALAVKNPNMLYVIAEEA